MKNWFLDFEVSTYFDEHLEFKDRKVKICSYDPLTQSFMLHYGCNKLAKLYGIETVGLEVMKSYSFLMDNRESRNIMLENKIWMHRDNFGEDITFRIRDIITEKIGYIVLADKFIGLERKLLKQI